MRVVLAGLFVLATQAALAAAPTAAQVQECMRANVPKTLQIKDIEVSATDRTGGARTLRGRLYGNTEDARMRAMMKILEPADLAGAAYLLREAKSEGANDEMYVYVPALAKVRRITGAAIDGSLWGTDLSYSDIKQIQNAFSGSSAKLESDGEIDKRAVHVMSFIPPKEQETRFTLIRAWVDAETCVPLKVEFIEGATATKRMVVKAEDVKQAEKHWYASQAVMTDLRQNTSTRLKVVGVATDGKLADRYFNPQTFYIGN
jgi:hypothetical protein